MHTGKQKQMNASYQASLVNRHIRRFTGFTKSSPQNKIRVTIGYLSFDATYPD